tara:strand:- start:98740 stop:99441 length:702 start_codon:yes stop_codon:yes gene_type:complete
MKRTTHFLSMTTLVLAAIIITMIVSPADANKRSTIESGDIAFVDVFKLVDLALSSEEMTLVRDDFNIKASQAIASIEAQLQTLQTEMGAMAQNDPSAATKYNEFQQLQGQLNNTSQQISDSYQTLIAQQISQGYEAIYAASNEIGTQEGFAFVFSTRTTGELIQTDTITGITQEILARPLMTPPASTDLTELVRIKLGYAEKVEVTEDTPESQEAVDPEPATEEPVTESTEND